MFYRDAVEFVDTALLVPDVSLEEAQSMSQAALRKLPFDNQNFVTSICNVNTINQDESQSLANADTTDGVPRTRIQVQMNLTEFGLVQSSIYEWRGVAKKLGYFDLADLLANRDYQGILRGTLLPIANILERNRIKYEQVIRDAQLPELPGPPTKFSVSLTLQNFLRDVTPPAGYLSFTGVPLGSIAVRNSTSTADTFPVLARTDPNPLGSGQIMLIRSIRRIGKTITLTLVDVRSNL